MFISLITIAAYLTYSGNLNVVVGVDPRSALKSRVGPPQRKLLIEDTNNYGRVSVHCVGSGINLPNLRAYIFRRGFGNGGELDLSSMKLDRLYNSIYTTIYIYSYIISFIDPKLKNIYISQMNRCL